MKRCACCDGPPHQGRPPLNKVPPPLCKKCNGTGRKYASEVGCLTCGGTGWAERETPAEPTYSPPEVEPCEHNEHAYEWAPSAGLWICPDCGLRAENGWWCDHECGCTCGTHTGARNPGETPAP